MAQMPPSDRPAPEALRALMEHHGLSYRGLSARTRDTDPQHKGFTAVYLNQIATGEYTIIKDSSLPTLELIARSVGEDPTYFREVREHLAAQEARRLTREIGLDEVLAKLRELNAPRRKR